MKMYTTFVHSSVERCINSALVLSGCDLYCYNARLLPGSNIIEVTDLRGERVKVLDLVGLYRYLNSDDQDVFWFYLLGCFEMVIERNAKGSLDLGIVETIDDAVKALTYIETLKSS